MKLKKKKGGYIQNNIKEVKRKRENKKWILALQILVPSAYSPFESAICGSWWILLSS